MLVRSWWSNANSQALLTGNVFISVSLLKDNLSAYRILSWQAGFVFRILTMPLHCILPPLLWEVNCIVVSLNHFSLAAFKIFLFISQFYYNVFRCDLFEFILLGIHWDSWICGLMISNLWKFGAIISSNIPLVPFFPSSSSMTTIYFPMLVNMLDVAHRSYSSIFIFLHLVFSL